MRLLPFDSAIEDYHAQAGELLEGHRTAESTSIKIFHRNHPRFLDENIAWLPRRLKDGEIQNTRLSLDDARLTLARRYCFRDWPALESYAEAVVDRAGPVHAFERTVEAVVDGDLDELQSMLRADPELIRRRSTRVTKFDPPIHRCTLLHYIAANGVEHYRQKTPKNAVEIAVCLLEAGADPDAGADLYSGSCTTMGLLVSSCHPAEAGLQTTLASTLLDFGASIEGPAAPRSGSPLMTALSFGYLDTAKALVERGARVERLEAAAGLGLEDRAASLLPRADGLSRHKALVLAVQHGHPAVIALLLDAGEDPDRYNPEGHHAHTTPLHQAALKGYEEVVRLLVERGARLDLRDKIYRATPVGWAEHGGHRRLAEYLRKLLGPRP